MKRKHLETILRRLERDHPKLDDREALLSRGMVTINGSAVRNPRTLVARDASVRVAAAGELRGTVKLRAALAAFAPAVAGKVALDLGASTGGFTSALLEAGAARVYAVDVGHGQLLGRLRLDPRVVNLEDTNLALLDEGRVPQPIDLVTVDLSYLAIACAVAQLGRLRIVRGADLIALVKPMFELGLAEAPRDHDSLAEAIEVAARGVEAQDWQLVSSIASPVCGRGGAREGFLHARFRERR
jgi:23S rRNA (cytidine1920-2'-O)/16S rRNA (cytidine1409-2'-O)-methyltransferase